MKLCVIWGDPASQDPARRFRTAVLCDACHHDAICVEGEDCDVLLVRPHLEGFRDKCYLCRKTQLAERHEALAQTSFRSSLATDVGTKTSVGSNLSSTGKDVVGNVSVVAPSMATAIATLQETSDRKQNVLPSCFGKKMACGSNRKRAKFCR